MALTGGAAVIRRDTYGWRNHAPDLEADARWAYQSALKALAYLATREANRTGAGNPPAGIPFQFRGGEESLEECWERVKQTWDNLERLLPIEEG
jgi:hypothetical protein